MSKEALQKTRLKKFRWLKDNPEIGKGKTSVLSRAIEKSESLTRFYLNPEKKGGRWMGEDFARTIEQTLGLKPLFMDIDDDKTEAQSIAETENGYSKNGFIYDGKNKHIKKPYILWSNYCKDINSVNITKELTSMLLEKDITVPKNAYIIEIDSDNYERLYRGTQLLIDPQCEPNNLDIVSISFDGNPPTLGKWLSELGALQVELLENNYPGSAYLENKNYQVLGTAIWIQKKGSRKI